MQAISLYWSRPDPQESVRNSSSVYQDTRYQDFPLIAMSGYPLKKSRCICETLYPQQQQSLKKLFLAQSQGHKVIDLGVIWKGIISCLCMPGIYSNW